MLFMLIKNIYGESPARHIVKVFAFCSNKFFCIFELLMVQLRSKWFKMKSITIHNLDERLSKLIEKKARESGTSLNKTIKKLLSQALGLTPKLDAAKSDEFLDLSGVWDENDFQDFNKNVEDLGKVDPEDWK